VVVGNFAVLGKKPLIRVWGTATIRAKLFVESFYFNKIKLLPGISTSWTRIKINGYVDLHFGAEQEFLAHPPEKCNKANLGVF
jgi:hypothetical protein